ncbi:hypothetical protein QQ045_021353 [Rhodiola kirilowii]
MLVPTGVVICWLRSPPWMVGSLHPGFESWGHQFLIIYEIFLLHFPFCLLFLVPPRTWMLPSSLADAFLVPPHAFMLSSSLADAFLVPPREWMLFLPCGGVIRPSIMNVLAMVKVLDVARASDVENTSNYGVEVHVSIEKRCQTWTVLQAVDTFVPMISGFD